MSEMFNKAMPRVSFCDSNVRLGDVVGFLREDGVYPAVVVAVVDSQGNREITLRNAEGAYTVLSSENEGTVVNITENLTWMHALRFLQIDDVQSDSEDPESDNHLAILKEVIIHRLTSAINGLSMIQEQAWLSGEPNRNEEDDADDENS